MKLIAIINAWVDTEELLPFCVESAHKWADSVLIMASESSNTGETINWEVSVKNCLGGIFIPDINKTAQQNELSKRNAALDIAKSRGFTHFIMMDADEFYIREEFEEEKHFIQCNDMDGVVHPLKVYVGKPTLWCEDHTLVPGIQKLKPELELGGFKEYPFAYDSQGNAHIDPTRRTNANKRFASIYMSNYYMHHMSYVRRDIDLKIRNSSANLRRSEAAIKRDIANAAPGYMSELYHRELKECENLFNITI